MNYKAVIIGGDFSLLDCIVTRQHKQSDHSSLVSFLCLYLAVFLNIFQGFVMSPVCSCSRSTRRLSLGWRSCPAELLDQQESPLPTASAAPPSSHLTDACRRKTPPSHSLSLNDTCRRKTPSHYPSLSFTFTHSLSSSPICFFPFVTLFCLFVVFF